MNIKKIIMTGLFFAAACTCLFAAPLSADQKQQLDIVQNSQKIRRKGNLPLYFSDAETGNPIKNAQIIISGSNGTYLTGKNGFISLPKLDDGDYTFTVSSENYISEELSFSVRAGFIPLYRFTLSRTLASKEYRIVLSWGEQPADLDLHLEKEGGFHISYRNMTESEDGSARLDRDDRNAYGPETITIKGMKEDASYNVYVVDFTSLASPSSTALSQSGAQVKVYYENTVLSYFWVPEDGAGNRWNVCRLHNGSVFYEDVLTGNQ